MSWNDVLVLIALVVLCIYISRKLMPLRDVLLVLGTACGIGFLLAGAIHRWALLIGLLLLSAESFYLGFIYRKKNEDPFGYVFNLVLRWKAQTAFVMGIALVIFVVYATVQGTRNVAALSAFIDVYEPHTSVEWVPRVDNAVIGQWILETDNSATAVMDFYEAFAARDGWRLESHAPPQFAILKKSGLQLTLMIQGSDGQDTTVIITLANDKD